VNFVHVHTKILELRVASFIHIDVDFRFQKLVAEDNIGHAMIEDPTPPYADFGRRSYKFSHPYE
jgi:hypothetical protein